MASLLLWLVSAGCGGTHHTDFGHSGSGGAEAGSDGGTTTPTDGASSDTGSAHDSAGTDTGISTAPDGCVVNATAPITGSVAAKGGSVSRLLFAVVGDTRPANEDDVSGYPTSIITKIYQDIEAQNPHPTLVLGTGDYQFASTSSSSGGDQVDLYMSARGSYTGQFFPAMGNHECGVSGPYYTSDNNNCGPGNPGGSTNNYDAFVSKMLAPISQTNPYYSINVNAIDGSWTAKFVITAANAWDTAQQTWLTTTMAQKTTYTFVVRHEPSDSYPPLPPGVAGVDAILATSPYTLLIAGHSHTYGHWSSAPQTVVIGNGGAPLSSGTYGYGVFSQRCDGAIVSEQYDYTTGAPAADTYYNFVITPAGTITM